MSVQATTLALSAIRYIDVPDADDLAAASPALAAYRAASDGQKTAALNEATADIDAAMPYQGRRFDPAQAREFPRFIDDPIGRSAAAVIDPANVWDWNAAGNTAAVPMDVRQAVLYQADSILAGARETRISAQHDGVVYELTGALAESYKATAGPGVRTGLCRRAWMLMSPYRRRGGRLL